MAVNQNGSQRGGAESSKFGANDIMARLGGPRVVIVLAVVVVIAIVAVTSIMGGISNTNQQTAQRAEEREQKADDEARAQRKKEKEKRHQEEAKAATVVNINDITDESLRSDLQEYADDDGNISQEQADKVAAADLDSFDSLAQLKPFKNINSFGVGNYNSESYDIGSISNIWQFGIGDCSVSTIDVTRFPKLKWLSIGDLSGSVDTVSAKNVSSLTKFDDESDQGHIGTIDLSGCTQLELLFVRTPTDTINLCGASTDARSFRADIPPKTVGKILYDSKTSSNLIEFLQNDASNGGYTLEQQ